MNPVDTFIDGLPIEKKPLVEQLRQLIHDMVPGVQEKLSFKIPFYHYFGMYCYINPVKNGVDLGICNGKKIADGFEHFGQIGVARADVPVGEIIRGAKEFAVGEFGHSRPPEET